MASGKITRPYDDTVELINVVDNSVSGESLQNKIERWVSNGSLPVGKPFTGRIQSSAWYSVTGELYKANNKLYGSLTCGFYGGIYNCTVYESVWTIQDPNAMSFSGYTPYIGYHSTGATMTLSSVQGQYVKVSPHLCIIGVRFSLDAKGIYSNTENIMIGLPDGIVGAYDLVVPCGMWFNSTGPTNLIPRVTSGKISGTNQGYLIIVNTIGGNYSAPEISTGYQGLFAIVPIK